MMNKLESKIKKAETIVITGHINPDGDCLGSTLGLYNYILNKYPEKQVKVHLEKSNEKFKILPGYDKIDDDSNDGMIYDLCVVCDCSTKERFKPFEDYFENAKDKIIIDHHETNEINDVVVILDGKAPATCQILYDLLEDKQYVDKNVATCLYTGLAHDSGVFRYSSTNKRTLEIAGELIATGIDFTEILDTTMFMKKWEERMLTCEVLKRAKKICGGDIIYSYTTLDEMSRFGVTKKDIDNIVVDMRENIGVKVAAFAYELKENVYKISLRANGNLINVADFAKKNNGGGHKKAAGFTLNMSLQEVEKYLDKNLVEVLA